MYEELKILILEDAQYDAELIEYEMRREGINFLSLRVETEIDFLEAIEDFKPDIILVDHSLPHFDGVSALEIRNRMSPYLPFIFVSGKIGEEFAVEMLKKGATDYVFKNNLKKLVPAINRALSERNEITELKLSKNELKKALDEKEVLLKEIHHRVKNNLMIISSLLDIQSHYIKDKDDYDLFKESKNRAYSMALIHEKLYRSTDLKMIDFGDYINKLAYDLFNVYTIDPDKIRLMVDVEDIKLDVDTAIPLGLIINELLTNSLKYAFPAPDPENNGKDNIISISLSKHGDEYILAIADNGIGFPEDIDYKNNDSMGLELVDNLIEQIDGAMELNEVNGTEFKIAFKE
ncbi:MAG: sensor histidine kinase [Methanobacterium sp.]